ARVLMNPERGGRLARALVQKLPRELRGQIEKVVSPAMGGIIIGHEVGRALDVDAIFVERPTGVFELVAGLLLAIDPILDMGRTAVNVAGQVLVGVIVAKREGILDESAYYGEGELVAA
ncbi:MAG: cation:dicarboxylase symporter family transporter, partial [Sphingobium yanoikuyae]|nr:cation:dicarboxylase symporter family transporter [Sphingobium yanoikuyae]